MATKAHCLFCFESLVARLESRPLRHSLPQVQELWAQYSGLMYGEGDDEEDEEEDEEEEDAVSKSAASETKPQSEPGLEPDHEEPPPRTSRRLGFGHLLSFSPTSRSQSSTPSSVTSSNVTRSPSEVPSKSSSRSSFFSPGTRSPAELKVTAERDAAQSTTVASDVEDSPLFVTWNTVGRLGHRSLRGCIGTFETLELEDGLRNYALTAALEDTRFSPISKRELPSLEVGVTLLTNFETCSSPTGWEIGQHGLRISFTNNSKRYGATYLPDVAVEQGWNKEETLVSLMRKAGWSGRKDEWRRMPDLKVVRYQGKKVVLQYQEWQEWRSWVEKQGLI